MLTGFGRAKRMTERAAKQLPQPVDVLDLDVNDPDAPRRRVVDDLRERWGRVDGVLHAIAFAPEDALGGNFLDTPPESAATAFQTSAYSLKALAAALLPLMEDGGAIVGMDFDAHRRLAGLRLDGRRQGRRSRPSRATWRVTSARRACA